MNNKVIWVFGPSASGKETFIKEVISNKELNIIKELKWTGKQILKIDESINYIKQYDNDQIGDKRVEIINKVIEINKNNSNSIILIKGQNIDIMNNLIELLKNKLPNVEYQIIYLFSDLNTIFERAKKKPWFTIEDDNIDDWYIHLVESADIIRQIKEIEIISIDTTNGYKISTFPEYK